MTASGSVPSLNVAPGSSRFVPKTSTVPPTLALAGENDVIFGVTLKLGTLVAGLPSPLSTVILPVVAPAGTVACSTFELVAATTRIDAVEGDVDVAVVAGAVDRDRAADGPARRREGRDLRRHLERVGAVGRSARRLDVDLPRGRGRGDREPERVGVHELEAGRDTVHLHRLHAPKANPLTVIWVPVVPLAGLNEVILGPTAKLVGRRVGQGRRHPRARVAGRDRDAAGGARRGRPRRASGRRRR